MWNVLIVLIIAIIIWMANPFAKPTPKVPSGAIRDEIQQQVQPETPQDIQQFQDNVVDQVQSAREAERQRQSSIINE